VVLANILLAPVPNQSVNQFGSLRVGAEVVIYDDVFEGNSSVRVVQRNVANTGSQNLSSNVSSGTLVSILGTRSISVSKKVYVFNGNLVFTSSNLGLGYYSANVGATIASPDRVDGNVATVSSVYLFANGAVQAVAINNRGSGYFVDPVVTITGPNTAPFVGTAQLSTL